MLESPDAHTGRTADRNRRVPRTAVHRAPSYSLLGPALLLYLMADAAAAQGHLDGVGAFTAVCAALLATVLTVLLRTADA